MVKSIAQSLDKAINRLNSKSSRQETCLFQQNIHFYKGRGIDLQFPNAKVWIAYAGAAFLSHNLFRAAQHYDIAVIGRTLLLAKSGARVRVRSDGRTATIDLI